MFLGLVISIGRSRTPAGIHGFQGQRFNRAESQATIETDVFTFHFTNCFADITYRIIIKIQVALKPVTVLIFYRFCRIVNQSLSISVCIPTARHGMLADECTDIGCQFIVIHRVSDVHTTVYSFKVSLYKSTLPVGIVDGGCIIGIFTTTS